MAAASIGLCSAGAQTNYVLPPGSLAPARNSTVTPFATVQSAANSLPVAGGVVSITPGTYAETPYLRNAARLERSDFSPGSVFIGPRPAPAAETTLRVMAYNCRLFDFGPGQHFADGLRAALFGDYFHSKRAENDVVALCEVWESTPTGDLYFDTIKAGSTYPHSFYGGEYGGYRVNNSGLGLLSEYPLSTSEQHVYEDCAAEDCAAAKGWIQADITKEGFRIRIYASHTQASGTVLPSTDEETAAVRRDQLLAVRGSIDQFLGSVPGGVAILMGDLNVAGESSEYSVFNELFSALGGRDATRNAETGFPFDHLLDVSTFRPVENELAEKFCEGCANQRLDYIIYFPSRDGSVKVLPLLSEVIKARKAGDPVSEDGFSTDELSDHYGLRVELRLTRPN